MFESGYFNSWPIFFKREWNRNWPFPKNQTVQTFFQTIKTLSFPTPPPSKPPQNVQNPFAFWFYFTITVTIITLIFISFSSLSPQDPKSWFLSLPTSLRQHYSKGRTIKVQTHPDQSPFEVFTAEKGVTESEKVIIVHGLGLSSYAFRNVVEALGFRGVHVVAFDLPGNGFSDKSTVEIGESAGGFLGRFKFVVSEIQVKGLFWAFDEIVATGQVPFEEIEARASKRKVEKAIELGPEEIGKVLGQVIETIGLAPVHLVLHDSALGMVLNWVLENVKSVRSVTLIDTGSKSAGALPLWTLEVPLVRELFLGVSYAHALLIKMSCSSGVGSKELEAHRVLLKGRDGTKAIVGMGKKLNRSFDIAEWGGSDGLKGVPMQLLWSGSWSKEWSEEGRRVANALPKATFVTHSGGRWAQVVLVQEELCARILTLNRTRQLHSLNFEMVVESGGKNIEVAVMTKDHGLRQLEEAEIDAIVADIEAEKAAAEAAKKGPARET